MAHVVIFDMDGTLIDSGYDITVSINHVRKQRYGLEPLSVEGVVDAINAPVRNLAEIFYNTVVYEDAARDLFEEHYYEQCIQNVRAYEGIPDLLEKIASQGMAMGVATNAPGLFAKRMLEHLQIGRYFDLIIGADEVETPKPNPQMIHRHLERHRYNAGTDYACMIGDNMKDMLAAKNAGIEGIFAGWGFSREGSGDHFVSDPAQVLKIITR